MMVNENKFCETNYMRQRHCGIRHRRGRAGTGNRKENMRHIPNVSIDRNKRKKTHESCQNITVGKKAVRNGREGTEEVIAQFFGPSTRNACVTWREGVKIKMKGELHAWRSGNTETRGIVRCRANEDK